MRRALHIAYRVAEMLVSLLSRFINAAFLCGSTHQTTSARMHIEEWPRGKAIINWFFFWQKDHCRWAWIQEVKEARRTIRVARRYKDRARPPSVASIPVTSALWSIFLFLLGQ